MHLNTILTGIIPGLGTPELILIALVVLLLFGGRKIPELMKGLGKGVKNFKDGMKGLEEDVHDPGKKAADTDKDQSPQG
jgi:sec-independent protein translocase protein TatA